MRAGAAWEKQGRAVRSQGPTFLFASWRSMGETGEGRAQPRPDLPLLRAGAAWEKQGRAVRSQGPTFLLDNWASWRSMGETGEGRA